MLITAGVEDVAEVAQRDLHDYNQKQPGVLGENSANSNWGVPAPLMVWGILLCFQEKPSNQKHISWQLLMDVLLMSFCCLELRRGSAVKLVSLHQMSPLLTLWSRNRGGRKEFF